ncbi:MAG: DUF2059 domain-containing protein [Verrucomicrobiota bacterium]
MKTHCLIIVFACLCPVLYSADQSDKPIFRAILDMGEVKTFSLSDDSGQQNAWVKPGDTFMGWEITRYDRETRQLSVTQGDTTAQLSIVAQSAETGAEPGTLAEAAEVFRLMQFDEMMQSTMDAQRKATKDMMRQQMAQSGAAIDEELLDIQASAVDDAFELVDWPKMKESMIQVYADNFSSNELQAFASFYSTPAGKAMINKHPVIQLQTMEVMMPEMMKMGPEIQKRMMERLQAYEDKKAAEAAGN